MEKSNKMMILAAFLLCATLVSIHFSSGLYAKYTVSENAGDGAKVAEFHIETDWSNNETPEFKLGGVNAVNAAELPFYIESRSDVAVSYTVKVTFGQAIPSYVILTLSDGTTNRTLTADGTKTSFEFEKFGTIEAAAGGVLRTDLVLTIGVTDLTLITQEIDIPNPVLTVQVDQID